MLKVILIKNMLFLAHWCIFCTLATEENIENIKLFQFIHKRNVYFHLNLAQCVHSYCG